MNWNNLNRLGALPFWLNRNCVNGSVRPGYDTEKEHITGKIVTIGIREKSREDVTHSSRNYIHTVH